MFFLKFDVPRIQLMVASYKEHGDSFIVDKTRVWSESRFIHFPAIRPYDPDSKHVVALMQAETAEPHDRVIFLLNFFDELRGRVPLNANWLTCQ
jgi:hypothetical protein